MDAAAVEAVVVDVIEVVPVVLNAATDATVEAMVPMEEKPTRILSSLKDHLVIDTIAVAEPPSQHQPLLQQPVQKNVVAIEPAHRNSFNQP